ncbi:threonine synthase [Thermopetrobacter sp. TC1]|uniref:threonine synthase n=1 Tax=Thermopetrobacter sp. TC1 TaxID=1495045 RepID=UPI000571DC19|nr:threonine synthase [Thermopetrobacter sp. TC1]
MRYISTRGGDRDRSFEDVLLAGLAPDGGLYVPEHWPVLSPDDWRSLRNRDWSEVAVAVMRPFMGDFLPEAALGQLIAEAAGTFNHAAVTPLKQLDDSLWLLELFHGPTLAFKDVAMQILARLMDIALERRGEKVTIIGATSGDTGSAAIEAFRHSRHVEIFILHPHGRVSEVQRRQMTTVHSPNVHNIAIEGDFDDCQALVKAMFNDQPFRTRMRLAGVNSINWARILAQVIYYATAALSLGAPHRPVAFTVPTGNFGDIFAGYVAWKLGLPIEKLVIATNVNDILHRALTTGRYEVTGVTPTTSPSMDIQVSSNFERLLFDALNRNPAAVRALMDSLAQARAFTIPEEALAEMNTLFASGRADEEEVLEEIRRTWRETGEIVDPHTAVGLHVARSHLGPDHAMISLATAHPAKFPDAVERAIGQRPALPQRLAHILTDEERLAVLPNDLERVEAFIAERVTG